MKELKAERKKTIRLLRKKFLADWRLTFGESPPPRCRKIKVAKEIHKCYGSYENAKQEVDTNNPLEVFEKL